MKTKEEKLKDIKEAFDKKGKYELCFGNDYLNITGGSKKMNCEFYHDGDFNYMTANYKIKGKNKDLMFDIPEELSEFVAAVVQILK